MNHEIRYKDFVLVGKKIPVAYHLKNTQRYSITVLPRNWKYESDILFIQSTSIKLTNSDKINSTNELKIIEFLKEKAIKSAIKRINAGNYRKGEIYKEEIKQEELAEKNKV